MYESDYNSVLVVRHHRIFATVRLECRNAREHLSSVSCFKLQLHHVLMHCWSFYTSDSNHRHLLFDIQRN